MVIQKKALKAIFYWACASIFWTYMAVTVIGAYKSWYIATALASAVAVFHFLTGVLNFGRLFRASILLLLYFGYLSLTALWAEYPRTTIWFVSTETIFIVIFALFYLLSLNFSLIHITDFFINLIPPAIIIFVMSYLMNPETIRMGGYAQGFLPFLLLFCTLRLTQSLSMRNVILITACLLMLVLGMSRTPLLAAGLGIILTYLTITKRWKMRLKLAAVFMSIGLVLTVIIIAFQPLRLYTFKTIARITYEDVVVSEQTIEAEEPDIIRWAIFGDALLLFETNWLFGIGYMNFMPWFGDEYDYRFENAEGKEIVGMSLHNSFQTWALEGGLPCLTIATLLLWKYFSILKKRIRQSESYMETSYYKTYVIAMICLLVMGFFHQVQQSPLLYAFLGIVYALDQEKRCETSKASRCRPNEYAASTRS